MYFSVGYTPATVGIPVYFIAVVSHDAAIKPALLGKKKGRLSGGGLVESIRLKNAGLHLQFHATSRNDCRV